MTSYQLIDPVLLFSREPPRVSETYGEEYDHIVGANYIEH